MPELQHDVSQLLIAFMSIEQMLSNPVKSLTEDTPCRSLVLFYVNGLEHMYPGTDMICPAKSHGEAGKSSFEAYLIVDMGIFKVQSS